MKKTLLILSLIFLISCTHQSKQSGDIEKSIKETDSITNTVEPLKLTITTGSAMPPRETQYELIGRELKISPKYHWQKRDSIKIEITQDVFNELSMISIDSLKDNYVNEHIMDGFYVIIQLKSKTINISNCYQPQIGFIIETLNRSIPETHKIRYSMAR